MSGGEINMSDEAWFKSSYSAESANCVEVNVGAGVAVRDSKDPDGPVLHFSDSGWRGFVAAIRDGEFVA